MTRLDEIIAARDQLWAACETDEERAQLRLLYQTAGWIICPHPECPPTDCQR